MRIHRQIRRSLAGLAFALLAVLAGQRADAKERFVEIIAGHLSLTYQPPCRLCHIQGTTGPGSVQTPFGVSMLAYGLTGSADTVPPALNGLAIDRIDSDGDTVTDIDELLANTDPNTAADVPLGPADQDPTYGCAVAGPGARRQSGLLALAVSLAAAAVSFGRRGRAGVRARARVRG